MRDLNFELKQLCQRNRDGSFATRADRERILELAADQLHALGYRNMSAGSLKPKHVDALLARWQAEGLAAGTLKNRMSALRWWAEKIGKQNVLARTNSEYGIAHRVYVTNVSKAKTLTAEQLAKITDPYTAMSLRLEAAFGLRRGESIKIQPAWADAGAILRLRASWCKGGRYREVPIATAEQRAVLDDAKRLAGAGSLIPAGRDYRAQLNRLRAQCDKAGIGGVHGLRHAYAQARFEQMAGRQAPAAGGPVSRHLTPAQKAADTATRRALTAELGHARLQVTAIYLGR